jgi:hypothetical protein
MEERTSQVIPAPKTSQHMGRRLPLLLTALCLLSLSMIVEPQLILQIWMMD